MAGADEAFHVRHAEFWCLEDFSGNKGRVDIGVDDFEPTSLGQDENIIGIIKCGGGR